MKPTDLKLKQFDEGVIRRIYMDLWNDKGVSGGPETWFMVIMRYLEYRNLMLINKKLCKSCKIEINPTDAPGYCDDCLYEKQRDKD